jgi:hypothetical protein
MPDDLYGYLAGQFADAALLGQTDEQAAVAGVSAETKAAATDVLTQGHAVLASPSLDWGSIGDYANRRFNNEAEARIWLTRMMNLLDAALKKL